MVNEKRPTQGLFFVYRKSKELYSQRSVKAVLLLKMPTTKRRCHKVILPGEMIMAVAAGAFGEGEGINETRVWP